MFHFTLDRGYAFSGEAGNDKLVTETLVNRLQKALHRQLFSSKQNRYNSNTKGSNNSTTSQHVNTQPNSNG